MKPLHKAAFNGQAEKVLNLIEEGIDVNTENDQKWTPIHYASQKGYLEIVKILHQHNAKIDCQQRSKKTPLHLASRNGHFEVVKFLCNLDVPIDANTIHGTTALHMAAEKGYLDIIKHLISKGAQIIVKTKENVTPLMLAIQNKHKAVAEVLAKNCSIEEMVDEIQSAPNTIQFQMAELFGQTKFSLKKSNTYNGKSTQITHELILNGCDDNPACSKLIEALIKSNPWILKEVRDDGDQKSTLLHLAVQTNQLNMAKCLLNNGAPIDLLDSYGWTSLIEAVIDQKIEMAKLLLQHGANVNINPENHAESVPLFIAIRKNNLTMAKLLLEHGADIDMQVDTDEHSKNVLGTPLTYAIEDSHWNDDISMVNLLLDWNPDLNARVDQGRTALHESTFCEKIELFEILVTKGADINAKDSKGLTPFRFALDLGNEPRAIELVKLGGFDLNSIGNYDRTALHDSVEKGFKDLTRTLVENKADLNIRDMYHNAPIHIAIVVEEIEIAKVLIEGGADLLLKTDDSKSVIEYAKSSGQNELAEMMIDQMIKTSKLKSQNEDPNAKRLRFDDCVICYDPRHDIFAMLPCGHAKTCEACCIRIMYMTESEQKCPVCRLAIISYKKIFH